MLVPPDDIEPVGISATGGINPQLAAKGAGRVGRTPSDAGSIPGPGRYANLGVNSGVEGATVAPHAQAGWSPICIGILHIGGIAGEDKLIPSVGNLPRRAAAKGVKIAGRGGDDVGRAARFGRGK